MRETLKQRDAVCTMRVTTPDGSFPCPNTAEVTVRGVRTCRSCATKADVTATPLSDALEVLLARALPLMNYQQFLAEGTDLVRKIRRVEAREAARR